MCLRADENILIGRFAEFETEAAFRPGIPSVNEAKAPMGE